MANKKIAAIVFIVTIILLFIPVLGITFALQKTFDVSMVVSQGNIAIASVQPATATPTEESTSSVNVVFTASDPNGYNDINLASAAASVTLGAVTRVSSSCTSQKVGNNAQITCPIIMNYYDSPGEWTISASISDKGGSSDTGSGILTYNTLYAFKLSKSTINFDGGLVPGTAGVTASNNPQTLTNTGNGDFGNIKITAQDLSNGVDTVTADSFYVNTANNYAGSTKLSASATLVPGAALAKGASSNSDVFIFADVPSGIGPGTYDSTSSWVVEAVES